MRAETRSLASMTLRLACACANSLDVTSRHSIASGRSKATWVPSAAKDLVESSETNSVTAARLRGGEVKLSIRQVSHGVVFPRSFRRSKEKPCNSIGERV